MKGKQYAITCVSGGRKQTWGAKTEEILKFITLICNISHILQGSGSTIPTWLITRWRSSKP